LKAIVTVKPHRPERFFSEQGRAFAHDGRLTRLSVAAARMLGE
jgi:hypothetical protein